jgi:hypothetical protein
VGCRKSLLGSKYFFLAVGFGPTGTVGAEPYGVSGLVVVVGGHPGFIAMIIS